MSVLLVVLAFVGTIVLMVLKALAVDQAKGQIQQFLRARLEATIGTMPDELQAEWADEWRAELAKVIAMPVTALQFVRGVRRSARALVDEPALAPAGAGDPAPSSFGRRALARVIPTWLPRVSQRLDAALDRISPRRTRLILRYLIAFSLTIPAVQIYSSVAGLTVVSGLVVAGVAAVVATAGAVVAERRQR